MFFASLRFFSLLGLVFAVFLTGCGMGPTVAPSGGSGVAFHGMVHGGQNPVAGAHVYLLAANTSGYGAGSVSLLSGTATGHSDSIGGYALTDANGNFSFDTVNGSNTTYDYTCTTPSTQVYLYALGGNTGGGANSAMGLMAALGSCGSLSSSTYVVLNEVTTVATAYALAGFAVDPLHVADDEGVVANTTASYAKTGMANAFATVNNLVNIANGTALATTPAGNGTAPQATINTLGNILASCVNSADVYVSNVFQSNSSGCTSLFGYTTANGLPGGTQPTDTAGAAINIAHNPGVNVSSIFGLASTVPPFAPALASSTAINDFMLPVIYTGGGALNFPMNDTMAIDAAGNVWITGGASNVAEFSNLGVALSPSADGYGGGSGNGGINTPEAIAVDMNGNAWVASYYGSVVELNSSGAPVTNYSGYSVGGNGTYGVAVDGLGDVWVGSKFNQTGSCTGNCSDLTEISSSGATLNDVKTNSGTAIIAIDGASNIWTTGGQEYTTAGVSEAGLTLSLGRFVIDNAGNFWSGGNNALYEYSSTGTEVSTSNGYTGGGLYATLTPALDGAGNVWVPNSNSSTGFGPSTSAGSVSEFTNTGVSITGTNGYTAFIGSTCSAYGSTWPIAPLGSASSLDVDSSGNVWVNTKISVICSGQSSVTELVGAAVPVVRPLAAGVKYNKLGTKP